MNHRWLRFLAVPVALTLLLMTWHESAKVTSAAPDATINVNSTADLPDTNPGDGVCATRGPGCTLRAAIMEANANATKDTIKLAAGTYKLKRVGTDNNAFKGDLDIKSNLNIEGAGTSFTVIDGNGSVLEERVFTIFAPYQVTMSGVTIRHGAVSGKGGAIYNIGALTLKTTIVRDSTAKYGGGIYNFGTTGVPSSLTLINSVVTGNTARSGGGIFNQGEMTVEGSIIGENTAQTAVNAYGGGIANFGKMEVTNTLVRYNLAEIGGGISNAGNGTLTRTTLSHNTANNWGGGISNGYPYPSSPAAALKIIESTISDNAADNHGGGISNQGNLTIDKSTVSGNTVGIGGGGIWNYVGSLLVTNSTLSNNSGTWDGGGIYVQTGLTRLFNVTVTKNIADSDGNNTGAGGGVYVSGESDGTLKFSNTIIAENYNYDASDDALWGEECAGALTSLGYNLVWSIPQGCTIGGNLTGNITGQDPGLYKLKNWGGPTKTHALHSDSVAIDRGNPAGCATARGSLLTTDQRGSPRPTDGDGRAGARCDIGAYELQP